MAKQSIILMTSTAGLINVTGQAVKFAGYFGMSRGIGTCCWYMNNFVGRIYIEASLATNPTEKDFFPIWLEGQHPYTQYPFDPNAPTGEFGGDTGIASFTFQANLVWIRARVDRSYIPMVQTADVGIISQILLNY